MEMDDDCLQRRIKEIDTLIHGLVEVTSTLGDSAKVKRALPSVSADMASLRIMRALLAREVYKDRHKPEQGGNSKRSEPIASDTSGPIQ